MWLAIEIRRARSNRNSNNAAKFYVYSYLLHFLFRRNFLHSLVANKMIAEIHGIKMGAFYTEIKVHRLEAHTLAW